MIMVVIQLEQAELYAAGIGQRAYKGGQSVPTEKVILRIPRILAQVKPSIPLSDQARIFANSSGSLPARNDNQNRQVAAVSRLSGRLVCSAQNST